MNKKPGTIATLSAASLMTVLAFAAGGCEEGMFEEAGEEIDEAAEDTGEAIEDAADEVDDAIDDRKDAGEKIEDAVDDAKNKTDG